MYCFYIDGTIRHARHNTTTFSHCETKRCYHWILHTGRLSQGSGEESRVEPRRGLLDCTEIGTTFSWDQLVVTMNNYVISYHVMSCHVMSCHVMSCHVMSCHVMSCHIISCHVISFHSTSSYLGNNIIVHKLSMISTRLFQTVNYSVCFHNWLESFKGMILIIKMIFIFRIFQGIKYVTYALFLVLRFVDPRAILRGKGSTPVTPACTACVFLTAVMYMYDLIHCRVALLNN